MKNQYFERIGRFARGPVPATSLDRVGYICVNRTVVSDLTAAGTKAPDDQAPEVT